MRMIIRSALTAVALLTGLAAAHASTVYVSTKADLEKAYGPNTTVRVMRGVDFGCPCTLNGAGVKNQPVQYIPQDNNSPKINLKGASPIYSDILTIKGAGYVNVSGFLFSDTNRNAVRITEGTNNVNVFGNEMTRVGQAVAMLGDYGHVYSNTIHDLTMVKNTPKDANGNYGDDDYGAQGFVIDGSHLEVDHNTVQNAVAPSYDYGIDGGFGDLFATKAISDISIHDNVLIDSAGFIEPGGSSATSTSITGFHMYNNFSINSGAFLIDHNGGGNFATNATGVEIDHNTVDNDKPNAPTNGMYELIRFDRAVATGTFNIHDNIWAMNGGKAVYKQHQAEYHHDNCIFLQSPYDKNNNPNGTHLYDDFGEDLAPGETRVDPQFVDSANYDLHLKSTSPCLGKGVQ